MKKISFILTLIGIFTLLIFLNVDYKTLTEKNLKNFMINEKVYFTGIVDNQVYLQNIMILKSSNITLVCNCKENLLNKKVKIYGKIEEFNSERQIRILRMNILN